MDLQGIRAANQEAQRLFRIALDERIATGEWNPVLTDAYLDAEENVRWEISKARLDALQEIDELADGEHFVGVGR